MSYNRQCFELLPRGRMLRRGLVLRRGLMRRRDSRVSATDTIVGLTWRKIAKINACPWFDRVDTKSNPVDGLSRGDLNGNWDIVPLVFPGAELSAAFRRAHRYAPS